MLKDTDILVRMQSDKMQYEVMDDYIAHLQINDEMVINAKLPEPGDYSLELYVKEKQIDGTFSIVCSYLVTSGNSTIDAHHQRQFDY